MTAQSGVRQVALAVILLAATQATHDLTNDPHLFVQAACWTAAAVGIVALKPGPVATHATGWLLVGTGVAAIAMTPLRSAASLLVWASLSYLLRSAAYHRSHRRIVIAACALLAAGAHIVPVGLVTSSFVPGPVAASIAVGVGVILYHAFVSPFLSLAAAHARLRSNAAVALRVVAQMTHADPHQFITAPSRLRMLEFLCRNPHLSTGEIALRLNLSRRTVEKYINDLLRDTGVENRRHLAAEFEYYYFARRGQQ